MGSIEKHGKGSFRLSVVTGYDAKGKPVRERKNVKVKNKTLSRQELAKFEAEVLQGEYTKPNFTRLEEFYSDWVKKYGEDRLNPRTLKEYMNIIEKRILPQYGHLKLSDLKAMHVVSFLDRLKDGSGRLDGKKEHLSSSTIRNCYKAFKSLLTAADEFDLIKNNPARNIKPPTVKQKKPLAYSREKLVALEEKHILEEKSAILFEQSLSQLSKGELIVKEIKNGMEGSASIPHELLKMVVHFKNRRKKEFIRTRDRQYDPERIFLFADELGKPMRPDNVSQWWARFRKRQNIEGLRFYDLRNYSVTYLIQQNVPTKSISSRVRHRKIGTTMDFYGHHFEEVDQVAAEHFNVFSINRPTINE
ncbi:tyrosine-type recombinase/integrase [Halobacillus yeomjeoni]|uniref:Tyrosine-type recombinase/integrase family protein n=1 Tax=Halobacillus yeomjeoni TaxID=311194 RepID=A0A931MV02_9BACI|nr:tyrosine-type recombinase/integrase [Halobacillus yeomjeoni]MBH0230070.1 tyrosine-type recombinase/integrase family protein [Halobacillus yeomjeoni]